jgi:hypothetical protein
MYPVVIRPVRAQYGVQLPRTRLIDSGTTSLNWTCRPGWHFRYIQSNPIRTASIRIVHTSTVAISAEKNLNVRD